MYFSGMLSNGMCMKLRRQKEQLHRQPLTGQMAKCVVVHHRQSIVLQYLVEIFFLIFG